MKLRKKIISVLSAAACAVSFCAGTVNAVTLDQPAITGSSVKINVDEESFNVYSAGETSWRPDGITVTIDGEKAEVSADDLKFTLDGEAVTPKSLYAGTSDEDYNGEYTLEVSYMDSEPVEYKAMIGQYGDVNSDHKVDVRDVMALMKNLLNEEEFPLSALQHELGNVEYDNDFNLIDVAKLIEYILGRMSADNLGPESSVAIWPEMTEDYSDYSAGRARIGCASVATFLDERVIVPVYLDTDGQKIDAVAARVKYDENYLTLRGICEPEEVGMRSGVSNGRLDTNPARGTFIILSNLSQDIAIDPSNPIVCCVFEVRDYVSEGTRFDIEIVNTINERNPVEVAAVQQPGEKSKYLMTEVRNGSILVEYKPVPTPLNTTVQTTTSKATTSKVTTSKATTSKATTSKSTTSKKTTAATKITTVQTTTATKNEPSGDANGDGETNVADIVAMQKYLFKFETITTEIFIKLDLYKDGKFNVFDLIILKRKVINAAN